MKEYAFVLIIIKTIVPAIPLFVFVLFFLPVAVFYAPGGASVIDGIAATERFDFSVFLCSAGTTVPLVDLAEKIPNWFRCRASETGMVYFI